MKAYKFYSDPNRPVSDGNTGLKILQFDENGIYITLDPVLANRMKAHFKNEEIELVEKEEAKEEVKAFKCKKCSYETDNKGELLAHYRENHPKEG